MLGRIARAIVELRGTTKLNQAAFAKHLGVSCTSIGHYEADSRRPDPGTLVKLAQAALAARRHDLAELFAGGLPGVREGLLVCGWGAWNGGDEPRSGDYPRMLHHRTKPPVTVQCAAEERALGGEWSRTVWQAQETVA
jgi:transcriptional regulator with XRE-family HTH domain